MWSDRTEAPNLDGIGPDDLVDTVTAAALAEVKPATISKWKQRGYLPSLDTDDRGRPLYVVRDVAKAEHRTRTARNSRR